MRRNLMGTVQTIVNVNFLYKRIFFNNEIMNLST